MKQKMKDIIETLLRGKRTTDPKEKSKSIILELKYGEWTIGTLWFADNQYHFSYHPKFPNDKLTLIPDFPKVDQEYTSDALFPFFELRIPSLKREEIVQLLEERNLKDATALELLAELGRKTTNDPYELEVKEAS